MLLYRSVGLKELELIYDSGMKTFPARLSQQPVFYPVLQLEYARQIASDWNTKRDQFAGYVTRFKMEDDYIAQFEQHGVGESQHQEFWIPAEELDEFNRHIVGHIKVVEAYFGDAFEGYIPDKFGMQGKDAVEQFTLLANSYIYKRFDFYLEIKRNHKAVFLNYPFWLKHEFKNPGLKEKILKAIKDGWLTSFPQIPLMNPIQEDTKAVEQTDLGPSVSSVDEEIVSEQEAVLDSSVDLVHDHPAPILPRDEHASRSLIRKDVAHASQSEPDTSVHPIAENVIPRRQGSKQPRAESIEQATPPTEGPHLHFVQGIQQGLSENYHEAIDELLKAVKEDPDRIVGHASLGVAFHRAGEDDRALSSYEAALQLGPHYAEAHYFKANILYSQGKVREAIAEYTIAMGLAPELIDAHLNTTPQDRLTDYTSSAAEMYWIAKRAHRILELNKSLEINPRQANLLKERAADYYRLWNYEQAIADYGASLKIHPNDASALYFRGVAYEAIGQHERALHDYQRAIAINPRLADIYINRGVTLGKMGNFRQSIESLTEGIRLAPQNPAGYFNRGMSHFQQGELESAIDDFSTVIRLSPGYEAAYYWRGIAHEEAGRQDEAISDYRHFLTITQNPEVRAEVEQKLVQWNEGGPTRQNSRRVLQDGIQKPDSVRRENQKLDVYDLLVVLGERALRSTWFGSGVNCQGQRANELYEFTDQNAPIDGHDFLQITSGIDQTIEGDFQAFDPGTSSPWIFIRAWEGSGFYIETNDSGIAARLRFKFQSVEDVEGVAAPYVGLFVPV